MSETQQIAGMQGNGREGGTLQANTILQTRYKILGVLGGGGMGTVYQARDLNFPDAKRLVAVKEMQNTATNPALREAALKTFEREANILATLSHPAIPKIFDFFHQNDRAYLVMEFINGNDIELLLSKTKELPIDKIIDWAIELCDVLDYLHSQTPNPIVFRDMKPSNVMIDSYGRVRLVDFGIAKTFVDGGKHTMIGTEGYSAPEQYKGDVTTRSDIYGLGATLHHILTRQDPRMAPPFSFGERPIEQFNSQVPRPLIDIVERALEFEAQNRFSSCAEMKAALEALRKPAIDLPNLNLTTNAAGTAAWETDGSSAIEPKWTFKTEDEIRCSPAAYNGIAYIGSYDTNIWAINIESGEMVWKFATEGGIASSPIVDPANKLVLFGSDDKSFYAVDARKGGTKGGYPIWSYATKGAVKSTGRIAHDHVFFGSDDGFVYALAAASGRFIWEYELSAPVRCRPYVTNELVIVGSDEGEVVGLALSGERKWTFRTRGNIIAAPFVDTIEGICFVGSADHSMYALDVGSGYNSWRFRTHGAIISSPIAHEGLLFFGSTDGNMYAINTQTSREKWRFTTEHPIVSSPTIYEDALYFGGTDQYLYCLDLNTGKERWKFKTNAAITSTPCIADGVILFGSLDNTFYALPLVG
ncbi:MAG: protein kinase [Chloroflexi bacterium]|nr:MAG: protein kinase [Chloroflexota bacterium]